MRRQTHPRPSPTQDHQDWLALVSVSGPFLALPVLNRVWPTLEAVDAALWKLLRIAHADGEIDPDLWIDFVLRRLLAWGDALRYEGLSELRVFVPEHGTSVEPDFALFDPTSNAPSLLGMILKPGNHPTARVSGDAWPAAPVDQVARMCRHHRVPLGLATDGRWFALVVAPPQGVTTTAVFDTATWPEAADRIVIRAFVSLLERRRFFGAPEADTLPCLFAESIRRQEEITEALGDQVQRAVEMLVAAMGWHDLRAQELRRQGLANVTAHDAYHAAVTMVMRIVFLLYAEERALLPADNDLYTAAYSVGDLADSLERQAQESSEQDLEHSQSAWLRLLALCDAIHLGVRHPRLSLPTYNGPMFDPAVHPWLPEVWIDDRTVLHVLRAILFVQLKKERRRLSFRALGVEQIGHVYERLLSFDAERAPHTVVGLDLGAAGNAEVSLAELDRQRSACVDSQTLASWLIDTYAGKKKGNPSTLASKLAALEGANRVEALRVLLAATGGERDLAERLVPLIGILRRDLRGLPVVIHTGSLHVTRSSNRASTGAHYTPPELASEVAEGALQDLVYRPGPAQTSNRTRWRVRPSRELLALRVADIAVGSGAFLVAACRYLAQKLIEAWAEEGDSNARRLIEQIHADGMPADIEADPLTIKARRDVIQHCLYGIDLDPMAVEVAKLSLWLISMDRDQPFTFLDDRLGTGDSLLGIATLAQLEHLHLDPNAGQALRNRWLGDPIHGLRTLVAEVAADRLQLADLPGDTLAAVGKKHRLLGQLEMKTDRVRLFADLIVGAALKNAGRPGHELHTDLVAIADLCRRVTLGSVGAEEEARALAARWLSIGLPHGAAPRRTMHWPLVFPEVFEHGGFDAILGNQPYLGGQKLTGVLGQQYREYLVQWPGCGVRGSADLVAYFVLRSHELLADIGVTGLVATNTLAQGDTREVGLARLVANGATIRRAEKSRKWPTRSAAIHVCLVNTVPQPPPKDGMCELDGSEVYGITDSLDARSRVSGASRHLVCNVGIAFQGSNVLGQGFTMEPARARELIDKDQRNADVLFPYLNGQDLNSRPDCTASRWVINFHNWPIDRARTYQEPFQQVERLVKPERVQNKDKRRREIWWQFTRPTPDLYAAIKKLGRVTAITLVSKVVMPAMVAANQVFAHKLGVFATDHLETFALLSSAPHYWWAITRGSTLETRTNYSPSDVFETLARPELTKKLHVLGGRLDTYRRDLMLARQAGLTATYNLVHDKACADEDIAELRRIHVAIDEEVMRAYGWTDLSLDHGFHDTRQGVRFTVGPTARQEILDRLLELNHQRADAEQAAIPRQRHLPLDDPSPAVEGPTPS
jgi:hypothetical protein